MGVGRKATPYILQRVTVMARDMVRLPTGGLALRGTPVYQRCPPFVRWVVVGAAAALARPQTPAWPRRGLRRVRGPRLRPIGFARPPLVPLALVE